MADITHNFGSSFQAIRPSLGPSITFLGSTDIELVVEGDFIDFGADARDSKNRSNRGGYTVDTTGLDMNNTGTYTIKYVAYDLVGRKTEITRDVVVKLGDPQVSSSSIRTLGDLNQDGTTGVFALMHPSTSDLNAKPVYDYQGAGVLANSDLAGITIDSTLLDLNPDISQEQLFIKVKGVGESHTLNLINSTSSALMLSSDVGLLIKDFTDGKSTVNFTTQSSGYTGEVVTLTAEAITINIAHGSSSHTLIEQLKAAYVAQEAEPVWGFSLVDFIADNTGDSGDDTGGAGDDTGDTGDDTSYSYYIKEFGNEIFNTNTPESNTFELPTVLMLAQDTDILNVDLTQESVPQVDGQYVLVSKPDGNDGYEHQMFIYSSSSILFLGGEVVSAPNTHAFEDVSISSFDTNVLPNARGYVENDIVFEDDGGMLMNIYRVNAENGYDIISDMGMNENPQYTGQLAGWSFFNFTEWFIEGFTVNTGDTGDDTGGEGDDTGPLVYATGLQPEGYPNGPVPDGYATPEAMITAIETSSQTARNELIGSQDITSGLFAPFIGDNGTLEQVSDITTIPGIASNITTVDITNAPVNKIVAGDEDSYYRSSDENRPQLTSPLVMSSDTSNPYFWDQLDTTLDVSGKFIHNTVIVLDSSHVLVFVSGQNKTKLNIQHGSSGSIRKVNDELVITIPASVTAAEMIYIVSRQRYYRLNGDDWEYFILKVS